ncbi:MAG: hypothetical protein M3017_01115, partial [Actinomycetota bacterium]|nr:hypothetical protein [Actinomycetota bacterium]
MESLSGLEMTLSDVAALARVQRPVVSMWRSRSAGSALPFPGPVTTDRGRDVFSASEIATWLEATGRGNNPTAAADLSAYASPGTDRTGDRSRFEALTALLVLRVLNGRALAGLSSGELLDAADDADPNDRFLYKELEHAADALPELAAYADSLADAAYNPAAAFETLMAARFRSGLRDLADVALTAVALDLVAGAAVELARQLGTDMFADASRGGSDLLLGVADGTADPDRMTVLIANDDGGASRLARRRLRVRGIDATALPSAADGSLRVERPVVHLAQYPSAGWPGMGPEEILAAVGQTDLQMDDAQRAVVLAPARVLCGPLTGRNGGGGGAARLRADLLRGGRVRAIIRLPAGLLRSRPREQQALWILGPSFAEVEIADR